MKTLTEQSPNDCYFLDRPDLEAFARCKGFSNLGAVPSVDGKFLRWPHPIEQRIALIRRALLFDANGEVSAKLFFEKLREVQREIAIYRKTLWVAK